MTTDFCSYHESQPAIWLCNDCARQFCPKCVVVIGDQPQSSPRCPLCEKRLAYPGGGSSAAPFWSVAHRFFIYPFSLSGGAFILLMGLLSLLIPYGFIGLCALLFAAVAAVKYCFAVMESVAMGSQRPPSAVAAVTGDENGLFIQLVGMLMGIALIQAVAGIVIGSIIGVLCAVLFALITPAMIMLFVFTGEIGAALSVQRIYDLTVSLGRPYLLVAVLTNVVATVPYVLFEVLGDALLASPFVLPALASLIAYFAVVDFAMLGYLGFEQQSSADPDDERLPATTDNLRKQLMGAVNVLAAEGRQADALQRFEKSRSEFAGDMVYHQRYFEFARQCNHELAIARASESYLALLVRRDAVDRALDVWREAAILAPAYKPRNPAVAHALARRAHARNLPEEALALLVNLHKRAPRYPALGSAYRLAATILRELGDDGKALQIEKFIRAFLQKRGDGQRAAQNRAAGSTG